MERRMRRVGILILIAVAAAGCASTPVERQEATLESLQDLREAMLATRAQVDATLLSLNALLNAPEGQLREAYARYAEDADTIAKQAARIQEESRQMRRRSEAWLAGWKAAHESIKDPELRALSERRREQVLSRFQAIEGSLAAAREALAPYVQNLQDLKRAIGNDLTARGVAAVAHTAVVQNANAQADAARRALDVAIADLRALIDALTPAASA